jgi:hypothetical protein
MVARFDIDAAHRSGQVNDGLDQHLATAGEVQHDGVAELHVLQLVPDQQVYRPPSPRTLSGAHAGDHDWHHEDLDRLVGY